jgi:hypothetical protein
MVGSGLVLLSKFKIESSGTYIYDRNRSSALGTKIANPFNSAEDDWANKGVLVAVIEGPNGKKFVISISHTAGPDDIPQLVDQTGNIANKLSAKDCAIIIAGDLNVRAEHRESMNKEFERLNAKDAWVELNGAQGGETTDLPHNKLDIIFTSSRDPAKDAERVQRLDYVIYAPNTTSLKPVEAHVIKDWVFPWEHGYFFDVMRKRWMSNYVAIRSFELKSKPYLFALKNTNRAYISRIRDNGRGWEDLGNWDWSSRYVGSAVRTFQLEEEHGGVRESHPYVFALKRGVDRAYISRIKDDGKGWDEMGSWKWSSNYVAVVPFYLKGHPYLFGLKGNNGAYISRIKDDGRGWDDVGKGKWASNYVANAITTFELKGHPYIFALKRNNEGYISRIRDDGSGWDDLGSWKWNSNYVAVVSYQLNGHPYLFGLKTTGEAYISRINDDGKGWNDVMNAGWSSQYVGTCITPFYFNGAPFLFALKRNDEGWITKLMEPGREDIDLSDHYPLQVAFRYA